MTCWTDYTPGRSRHCAPWCATPACSLPKVSTQNFLTSHPHLANRVPLVQLAFYLGITPQSLSRVRKNPGRSLDTNK